MIPKPPARALALSVLSLLPLLWSGCETTAPAAARPAETKAAAFPRESVKRLRVGMPKATVIELIGQPAEIKKIDPGENGGVEVWTYVNWLDPVYREVAVEMEETPYVDPVTGIERTILDPRQQLERINRKEFFELTFDASETVVHLNYDLEHFREI